MVIFTNFHTLSRFCFQRHKNFSTLKQQDNELRIVLMGVPGSGKGTQATKLTRDFKIPQFSTGDILRNIVTNDKTEFGKKIAQQMSGGGLVSDEILLDIVETQLKQTTRGWILDGFPRTLVQAEKLDDLLSSKLHKPLDLVFYLNVDVQVIYERIKDRFYHEPSGRTYNLSYNPPKIFGRDDITGEPLTKRKDDNLETIQARMKAFYDKTKPLLKFYEKDGRLVTVDSPTSDVGYVKIKEVMNNLCKKKNFQIH